MKISTNNRNFITSCYKQELPCHPPKLSTMTFQYCIYPPSFELLSYLYFQHIFYYTASAMLASLGTSCSIVIIVYFPDDNFTTLLLPPFLTRNFLRSHRYPMHAQLQRVTKPFTNLWLFFIHHAVITAHIIPTMPLCVYA